MQLGAKKFPDTDTVSGLSLIHILPVGVYGMLLNVPAYRAHLAPFLLLAVLGAALGFVISEMVIRKSLRIPRTVWRGCAVTAAVCCLVVVGAKCDLCLLYTSFSAQASSFGV